MFSSMLTARSWVISSLTLVTAQSIQGGSYLQGGGVPGGAAYQLADDYEPAVFFNKFNLYSSYDPTYGHVQYVNQTVATRNGYISTTSAGTAKIGVDTVGIWPRGGPGRPSVRLISDNTYEHGLFIFDAVHMPWGCGTWPAYWLLGPNWPFTGEIDIIEGVNTNNQNSVSLHSSANCTVAGSGQTGTLQTTNCDVNANGNSGCGSTLTNNAIPNNYGSGFNANGGGVYATEWTSSYFKTWFFPRGSIPPSITNGTPDPSKFGTPAVNHQGSCNIDQHFQNMSIIINIDFCGAWAGQVYSQYSQCPQNTSTNSLNSCVDFVGNNPSYFTNAYFEINSIKVYQMPLGAQATASYTTSLSSVSPPSTATTNSINLGMGASTTVSSAQYTGPVSSFTISAPPVASTPAICPTYNNTNWRNFNGQSYTIGCGFDYNGAGTGLPGNGIYSATSFENCLEICDTTSGCIAVAFVGGNGAGTCYAKSTRGALVFTGSTNAAIKLTGASSIAATSTPTPSPPACPGSAASTYIDSGGIAYSIICYTDYTGNNIGSPIAFGSLTDCLPACDSMSGCAGVVYNPSYGSCQLKSSFTGTQSGNNSVIAARRNIVPATSVPSISGGSSSSAPDYGGYGGIGAGPSNAYGQFTSSSSVVVSSPTMVQSSFTLSTAGTTTSTSQSLSSSLASSISVSGSAITATTSSSTSQVTSSYSAATILSTISSSTSRTSSSVVLSTSSSPPSSSMTTLSISSSSSSVSMSSTIPTSIPLRPSSSPSMATTSSTLYALPISSTLTSSNTMTVTSSTISTSTASVPISTNSVLQTLTTLSVTSTWAASQIPGMSTISSIASATACPTNAAGYCSSQLQQSRVCSDTAGAIYYVSCNIVYTGIVIDTAGVYGRELKVLERATVFDVASCQRLCDTTMDCVAFNFIGANCVLLSRVDGRISNANAIGGTLIRAAPPAPTSTSSALQAYGTTTPVSTSASTFVPSSASTMPVTITGPPTATVTLTATLTTNISTGGYFSSGSDGSFYIYSSSQGPTASLCYSCGLTPTVVTGVLTRTVSTCLPTALSTTTIYTTTTITSCPPQPTCPAPGYVIIGGSQTYPGQQVVVTTDNGGRTITYTQIPSSVSARTTSTSVPGPGSDALQPSCPDADGTIFTDSMGMRYQVLCGTEFTDTNLDVQTQSTLGGCIASCDMYNTRRFYLGSQCLGVSWFDNQTTDNCLLKSGTARTQRKHCDSCALLTTNGPSNNNTITASGTASYGIYTTVVGGTTAVSVYTTTLPASTVTVYTTIFTGGSTIITAISTTTIPASTITQITTRVVPGSTIVTQGYGGAGGYYGGGNGGGPNRPGDYGPPSTVYGVSTGVSTFVSNGQTIYSTYGVTTAYSVIYLPGTTQTVTTTSLTISLVPTTIVTTLSQGYTTTIVTYVPVGGGGYYGGGGGGGGGGNGGGTGPGTGPGTGAGTGPGPTQTRTVTTTSVSVLLSVTLVPTTIVTTVSQGYTTTIVTYLPRTYTQQAGGGYGYGQDGAGGGTGDGTVTITAGTAPATTVFVTMTVTTTVLPSSSSSTFTCRTYATNYLNGLHGRSEPTSAPMMRNGIVLSPVLPAEPMRRKSVFDKQVILAEVARMRDLPNGVLSGELDLWFIE